MLRLLLFALLVLGPACKKASDEHKSQNDSPVSASRPISKLGDVVATLQIPSGNDPGDLAKVIDNIQPGASAMLGAQLPVLLQMASGMDFSAADMSGPISLLVLNPDKHPEPFALLVKAEDRKAMEASAKEAGKKLVSRDGLVLVGAPGVVDSAQSFAFANLAKPSSQFLAIVYPAPLVQAYGPRLDAMLADMNDAMAAMGDQGMAFQTLFQLYREGLTAVGEQSDRLVMSVGVEAGNSELYLRLYPKPGTTMAAFVDAQVPADHSLLGKLPASASQQAVFSGEMRAGAARDAFVDFSVQAMATLYGQESAEELVKLAKPWMEAFDGSFAMSMAMNFEGEHPEMSMDYLMGAADTEAMRRGWRSMFKVLAERTNEGLMTNMMGMKFLVEFKENATQVDGVEVDYYSSKIDPASVETEQLAAMKEVGGAEQEVYAAIFDEVAAMTTAKEGAKSIEGIIAAARGKAPGFVPAGPVADAIATSKARNESLFFLMDFASFMPSGGPQPPFQSVIWGMGKDQGALTMRFSIGK